MKKHIKKSELYTTIIFGLLASLLVDTYASFRFEAWGFFEKGKAEFSVLLILLGIYPAAAAMIVNWYPYKSRWWLKLAYILGWTICSTGYEWLTLKTGILWHVHWNLFYSLLLYPAIYYMLIVHVRIYRWLQKYEKAV
ncbi:CBO0543 family protein [Paenibacillus tarimensis]